MGNWKRTSNYSFFEYIKPYFCLSKIEKDNYSLNVNYLDRFVNGQYVPIKYNSTLEFRQYENLRTGLDVNVVKLDIPNFKSHFTWEVGFRYGRTALVDSVRSFANGVYTNAPV